MALIHSSLSGDLRASFTFLGSSASCEATINASPSISKRRRGTFPRLLLREGKSKSVVSTTSLLPLGTEGPGRSIFISSGVSLPLGTEVPDRSALTSSGVFKFESSIRLSNS